MATKQEVLTFISRHLGVPVEDLRDDTRIRPEAAHYLNMWAAIEFRRVVANDIDNLTVGQLVRQLAR